MKKAMFAVFDASILAVAIGVPFALYFLYFGA